MSLDLPPGHLTSTEYQELLGELADAIHDRQGRPRPLDLSGASTDAIDLLERFGFVDQGQLTWDGYRAFVGEFTTDPAYLADDYFILDPRAARLRRQLPGQRRKMIKALLD